MSAIPGDEARLEAPPERKLPGRSFTACGSEEVDRLIETVLGEAREAVERTLEPARYRVLALMGGYGRGEGGVELRNGRERPHNNLDLLLVVVDAERTNAVSIKSTLDRELAPLVERHEIGIDLGIVTESQLRWSPVLVMWYDLRFGHRVILGDASFIASLDRFSVERIWPADIRNLLINRGTLLLINDHLLASRVPSPDDLKVLIRHAMKAIIGYGDAFLFFKGVYHWSYQEKRDRMRMQTEISDEFREAYDTAMAFRFRPDYPAMLERDIPAWLRGLRRPLQEVHLACEASRLQRGELHWHEYPGLAGRHAIFDGGTGLRAIARKARNLLRSVRDGNSSACAAGWLPALGVAVAGTRESLSLAFPVIAYDLDDPNYRRIARGLLNATDETTDCLRRAYLAYWARHGDLNFDAVLRRFNLSVAPPSGDRSDVP